MSSALIMSAMHCLAGYREHARARLIERTCFWADRVGVVEQEKEIAQLKARLEALERRGL